MKKLNVNITRNDIKKGIQANPENCAIAKSLNRSNKFQRIRVFHDYCMVSIIENGKFKNYKANLPEKARNFVRNFDHGYKVEPLKFHIELKSDRSAPVLNY